LITTRTNFSSCRKVNSEGDKEEKAGYKRVSKKTAVAEVAKSFYLSR